MAGEIDSTEASIYRYFSNKGQLLLYLTSWYWEWMHHLVVQEIAHYQDAEGKLRAAVGVLTKPWAKASGVDYIDQSGLHQLIINEGTKAYRTKLVDRKNEKGFFLGYKELTETISNLFLQVSPGFKHPRSLASSLFEMAHDHPFFAKHLPRLTDLNDTDRFSEDLENMLWIWTTRLLDCSADVHRQSLQKPSSIVFISRKLKPDSPLLAWSIKSGNLIFGYSFLRFTPIAFDAPTTADWWFFYSAQAVKHGLAFCRPPDNVCLAALGEGTAQALRELAGRVDFVGHGAPGQVAKQFVDIAGGLTVFFPRAENSKLTIQKILSGKINALDAVCYSNEPVPADKGIKADIMIFTSPLNVAAYLDYQTIPAATEVIAIGGSTASALYQRGYVTSFPNHPSEEALVGLLNERYQSK